MSRFAPHYAINNVFILKIEMKWPSTLHCKQNAKNLATYNYSDSVIFVNIILALFSGAVEYSHISVLPDHFLFKLDFNSFGIQKKSVGQNTNI